MRRELKRMVVWWGTPLEARSAFARLVISHLRLFVLLCPSHHQETDILRPPPPRNVEAEPSVPVTVETLEREIRTVTGQRG